MELCQRIIFEITYQNLNKFSSDYQAEQKCNEQQEYLKKTARNIPMRLKDSENKFSGNTSQWQKDFQNKYDQAYEYYNLNEPQRLRYIHSLLSKKCAYISCECFQTFSENVQRICEGGRYRMQLRSASNSRQKLRKHIRSLTFILFQCKRYWA